MRYRLRRALELFFAEDGDAYLLRGGSGEEHIIREPSAADRDLLRRLAADGLDVVPASDVEARIRPLIQAGAVIPTPDVTVLGRADAERFDRQLPYFEDFGDPVESQRRLRDSAVAVLGCGGLGTWALGALASAGVGRFVLIDDDRVDLSNLNRQVLYGVADVGEAKVERAAAWLAAFDPSIRVETERRLVRGPQDLAFIAECDVLLLTADWPPYELARWVNAASLQHGVPYVVAGQQPPLVKIGPTYVPGDGACFVCHEQRLRETFPLYDELAAQRRVDPPAATTLGPASALVGSLLSLEVLHVLVGQPVSTRDRMLVMDIRTLDTRWTDVERDPDCPACGG